jgi:small GTP-binding protein
MLGSFSVGKTSLVRRYVDSIFSEQYKTTIGVKIDKKVVEVGGKEVNLLLWDLHGDDEFQRIRPALLRGTHGFFLVVDPTRSASLEVARELEERLKEQVGDCPFLVLLNKCDLEAEWEISPEEIASMSEEGWRVQRTSAKTGQGVEEAFLSLARSLV